MHRRIGKFVKSLSFADDGRCHQCIVAPKNVAVEFLRQMESEAESIEVVNRHN